MNKKDWGPGPWRDEPDRHEFRCLGLPCLAARNTDVTGSWCGYVGIPKGHSLYGKHYRDLSLDVHGGLTFSSECSGHICHVPKKGESDHVWWVGFDCSHGNDISPAMVLLENKVLGLPNPFRKKFQSYKDLNYVKKQIRRLARQVKNAGPAGGQG